MYYYKAINDIYVKTNVELCTAVEITEEEYNITITRWFQTNTCNITNLIDSLKLQLANSDYKAIKYAEGEISEEDYQPIKAERRNYRQDINTLQEELLLAMAAEKEQLARQEAEQELTVEEMANTIAGEPEQEQLSEEDTEIVRPEDMLQTEE